MALAILPARSAPLASPRSVGRGTLAQGVLCFWTIVSTGAEEEVPSGVFLRTRFHIICWSTIVKTPYKEPARASVASGLGERVATTALPQTAAIIMVTKTDAQGAP